MLAYLADLDRQLRVVVNSAANDPGLKSLAHKIVSQTGMLGLTRLSECARALEDACRAGATPAPALRRCRAAVGDIELYAMPAVGAPPGEPPAAGA
ncbi:MAG TPA: Hpt domain-containing protein [Sphingomicrobium sp.]|nr:Hpt domain-containing protein [Sphingomicrobium sp.]